MLPVRKFFDSICRKIKLYINFSAVFLATYNICLKTCYKIIFSLKVNITKRVFIDDYSKFTKLTTYLEQAKPDIDIYGYCMLKETLSPE